MFDDTREEELPIMVTYIIKKDGVDRKEEWYNKETKQYEISKERKELEKYRTGWKRLENTLTKDKETTSEDTENNENKENEIINITTDNNESIQTETTIEKTENNEQTNTESKTSEETETESLDMEKDSGEEREKGTLGNEEAFREDETLEQYIIRRGIKKI